ncbi:MAG: DUF305 domain-containing protein [Xanthobacteraceae bacterium]|nr:DUF305 domain-containing protein [Xanthobacteraceae bacterium]
MSLRRIVPTVLVMMLATASIRAAEPADDYSPFMKESQAAMTRMMDAMNIDSTGDVDRDFAAMMIPHHQGAIDMALAMLRYGRNEQLKRIAQEIIVEQQQEIDAMRLAVGLPPASPAPAPAPAPTQAPQATGTDGGNAHHHGHMQKEP